MDYKPYTLEWVRKRALRESIYDYLEDLNASPEQISEDILDILEEWISTHDSRVKKARDLKNLFKK